MLITVEANYVAGGYPAPTYRNTIEFKMNVFKNETLVNIEKAAKERARREVAKLGCWAFELVKIKDVKIKDHT